MLLLGAGCAARQQQAEGAASAPSGEVVLGAVLPMSGAQQPFGLSVDRGIRLAVEERNAKGGVRGRRVAYQASDSRSSPDGAVAAMLQATGKTRALAVIGEVASSRTLAMLATAGAERIPLVTPTATNPLVTVDEGRVRPYVFRACAVDPHQGVVMARYALSRGLRRFAVLVDETSAYSVALARRFRATLAENGGLVAADLPYRNGDREFGPQLEAVRQAAPEAIYLPGYYDDVGRIAREARKLGIRAPFMGGDGWDSHELHEIAEGALDGSWFTNHQSNGDPTPELQQLIARYRTAFGSEPDTLGVLGYDTARLVLDAMERAEALTGPGVRDALERTRRFPGVSGAITLDAQHDALKPMVIMQIGGGTTRFVTRVEPPAR